MSCNFTVIDNLSSCQHHMAYNDGKGTDQRIQYCYVSQEMFDSEKKNSVPILFNQLARGNNSDQ